MVKGDLLMTFFILNYALVSIPQTLLFFLLILLFNEEYHFFLKKNFIRTLLDLLIIVVLPCSLILNSLFYYSNLNLFLRVFLNSLINLIFITHFLQWFYKKSLWKEYLESYSPETPILIKPFKKETNKYLFTIKNYLPKVKYKNKKGIYKSIIIISVATYIFESATVVYLKYFDFQFETLKYK